MGMWSDHIPPSSRHDIQTGEPVVFMETWLRSKRLPSRTGVTNRSAQGRISTGDAGRGLRATMIFDF